MNSCHHFSSDTQKELELVKKIAKESGAFDAVICNHWAQGGAGAAELAAAVDRATQAPSNFKFLYQLDVCVILADVAFIHEDAFFFSLSLVFKVFEQTVLNLFQKLSLEEKIETIAKEIYGADGIDIQPEAMQRLALYTKQVRSLSRVQASFTKMRS